MIYELLRRNDLKRRAKQRFKEKIVCFLSVFSDYSIHFNILKSGPNQNYDLIFYLNVNNKFINHDLIWSKAEKSKKIPVLSLTTNCKVETPNS